VLEIKDLQALVQRMHILHGVTSTCAKAKSSPCLGERRRQDDDAEIDHGDRRQAKRSVTFRNGTHRSAIDRIARSA